MNCLIITELFWPEGSGAELATYLYAKLLSRRGVKVTVLTGSLHRTGWQESEFPIVPWVPSVKPQTKYSSLFLASCLVRNLYRTLIEQSDVVYISKCCWAIPFVKSLGKPVVVGVHEYSPICPTTTLYNNASETVCNNCNTGACLKCVLLHERKKATSLKQRILSMLLNVTLGQIYGKFLRQADAIIFVSNYQRNTVVERMPSISDKSYVLSNPVPAIDDDEVKGHDYGFYGGTSVLKGFKVLSEGLQKLSKHVKVHIAGTMDKRMMVSSSLLTYHGWLDPSAYRQLIKRTKATIFPSILPEPCPYVVVESMLYSKLIIASKIGGISEITGEAPGVFLFPAGNSMSLGERIEQVESMDRDTVLELGKKNREFVKRRFQNNKTTERLLQILNEVAD
jgi:glycosyltransferase involved in cell wall biosynthesis